MLGEWPPAAAHPQQADSKRWILVKDVAIRTATSAAKAILLKL
jgi:hypothetical protein